MQWKLETFLDVSTRGIRNIESLIFMKVILEQKQGPRHRGAGGVMAPHSFAKQVVLKLQLIGGKALAHWRSHGGEWGGGWLVYISPPKTSGGGDYVRYLDGHI